MYIDTVLSYKQGWNLLSTKFFVEYQEILGAIDLSTWLSLDAVVINARSKNASDVMEAFNYKKSNGFTNSLNDLNWFRRNDETPLIFSKNNILIYFPTDFSFNVYKWLFDLSKKSATSEFPNLSISIIDEERYLNEIIQIGAFNQEQPFIVVYVTNKNNSDLTVIELEPTSNLEDNIVLDKFIMFPPEYYQAGLGILNYFSSYLQKNYPDDNATVKIEQSGQSIRLTVVSEDGNTEVIEKALTEYELIVTGEKSPEDFSRSKELILELKNELRFAQVRIESQQDIIGYLKTDKATIQELLKQALQQERYTTIEVSPVIQNHLSVVNNNIVNEAIPLIEQLKEVFNDKDDSHMLLENLEDSLRQVTNETDPDKLKNSRPMEKFRKFINRVNEGNDDISQAIKTSESAFETFQKLAGKYNKIAEWCGMPVIPSIFTK